MRFSTVSLFFPLVTSVAASTFPSHSLDRRETFELTEREDSGGDKGWIVPANVTVEDWDTAEPGEGWIPVDEYMRRMGIAPWRTFPILKNQTLRVFRYPKLRQGHLRSGLFEPESTSVGS